MNESTPAKAKYKPHPEDIDSPSAIVRAMYESISGPAGERQWSRLRSLFADDAQMIPTGDALDSEESLRVLSVEEWIDEARPFFLENDFWESEIMNHSDRFGNIVQVFSTYEARDVEGGQPITRGINSIQMVYSEERWWVLSCMWDRETKDNPVPGEFLPYLW
jgi:hypothetical protein